jgi:hypothetical protein
MITLLTLVLGLLMKSTYIVTKSMSILVIRYIIENILIKESKYRVLLSLAFHFPS